jgi:hypothetical protein
MSTIAPVIRPPTLQDYQDWDNLAVLIPAVVALAARLGGPVEINPYCCIAGEIRIHGDGRWEINTGAWSPSTLSNVLSLATSRYLVEAMRDVLVEVMTAGTQVTGDEVT